MRVEEGLPLVLGLKLREVYDLEEMAVLVVSKSRGEA